MSRHVIFTRIPAHWRVDKMRLLTFLSVLLRWGGAAVLKLSPFTIYPKNAGDELSNSAASGFSQMTLCRMSIHPSKICQKASIVKVKDELYPSDCDVDKLCEMWKWAAYDWQMRSKKQNQVSRPHSLRAYLTAAGNQKIMVLASSRAFSYAVSAEHCTRMWSKCLQITTIHIPNGIRSSVRWSKVYTK